jgi:hypothetical protein
MITALGGRVSGNAELDSLYSAIEESARLLDISWSPDKVWHILATYGDQLDTQAAIAFRVATGARHVGELDFRFTVPPDTDPYNLALSNGLTRQTSHPAGALLPDIRDRCPVDCYGIDFGVVGGFKKIWPFFPPDDLQGLPGLAAIPSMPRGLAANASFFDRHGLASKVSLTGIDYQHHTVNVYFGELPGECLEPAAIASMLRELGLPDPSEQMLRLGQQAFGIYATFSWDSPNVERFTFAVVTQDPTALSVRLEPKIERFVREVPYAAANRKFVYTVSASPDGEYYKLQSYYQWRPGMADRMLLSDSIKDLL